MISIIADYKYLQCICIYVSQILQLINWSLTRIDYMINYMHLARLRFQFDYTNSVHHGHVG